MQVIEKLRLRPGPVRVWNPAPTFNGAFTLVGTAEAVSVPEPASWSLLVLALAAASLTLARRPAAAERQT